MRLIAFYLPQYHPIPENDAWWGAGFTDWVNVQRGRPRFAGHHQPHVPTELGAYDLRDPEVREAQAALARAFGIDAFCYYHYWFNGRRLLGLPFDEVLASGRPDHAFCLCWANENWTRRWDGRDREILMRQDYDRYSPEEHFDWLAPAFADPRHVTVGGRPLFLVYRPDEIPDVAAVLDAWRRRALAAGLPGLYLCAVDSPFGTAEPADHARHGFDAVVEFHPSLRRHPSRTASSRVTSLLPRAWNLAASALSGGRLPLWQVTNRHSYERYVRSAMSRRPTGARVLPCVMPSWDNSARKRAATVIQNDDPALYGRWLAAAIEEAERLPDGERFVFVNAWNEWAEGCHLEPDRRNGQRFLEATRSAVESARAAREGRSDQPSASAR